MINKFLGTNFFLSNYYMKAPFQYGALTWASAEHAFQAAKCKTPSDMILIHKLKTPEEARRCGQRITLRSDWEDVKDRVLFDVLFHKFKPGSDIHARLMATGKEELVECGHDVYQDPYWGVVDGVGKNKLGKILMAIRSLSE